MGDARLRAPPRRGSRCRAHAGDNAAVIDDILAAGSAATSVGGGVRTTLRVEELVGAGAAAVVVGTRAIEEPEWLEEIAGVSRIESSWQPTFENDRS